jgi:hypothetical protein
MSGDEAVPASLADPSSVGAKKPSPLIHRHPCATIKAGSKVDNFFPSSYLFKHDFLQIHAPHPFFRASRMLVKRDLKAVKPKALIFDLIGTCCDWYSSLLPALASSPDRQLLSSLELSQLALSWRAGFFNEIHARFQAGKAAEDIDVTHRRVLDRLLHEKGIDLSKWNEEVRRKLVDQWHEQIGESIAAFGAQFADFQCFDKVGLMFFQGSQDCVKNSSCKSSINLQQVSCSSETSVVLANGTTRLQLDIVKSSSLPFHMLFSSELLGLTKVCFPLGSLSIRAEVPISQIIRYIQKH